MYTNNFLVVFGIDNEEPCTAHILYYWYATIEQGFQKVLELDTL